MSCLHPPHALSKRHTQCKRYLIPLCARRLPIFPQLHQQFSEPLFPCPTRAPFGPLPTQIHQLRYTLPARTATTRILPIGKEFLGFFARLSDRFIFFRVVVFVEVVDSGLGRFYGFGFFAGGGLRALGKGGIAAFTPLSRLT